MAKSTRICPVCGFGYRGPLSDHLDKPIWSGYPEEDRLAEGVPLPWMRNATRCDWNLNTVRIRTDAQRLVDAGFIRAGVMARVITPLKDTHPHLVRFAPTGTTHPTASPSLMGRDHDPKVWWCKAWVWAIANFPNTPMRMRRAIVEDLDAQPTAQRIVETALQLGGWPAVRQLGDEVIPPRCLSPYGYIRPALVSKDADTCVLAKGHPGDHLGLRGSVWFARS